MRLRIKEYGNHTRYAVLLTTNGHRIVEEIEGTLQPMEEQDASLEIAWRDNSLSRVKVREALHWAIEELDKLNEKEVLPT